MRLLLAISLFFICVTGLAQIKTAEVSVEERGNTEIGIYTLINPTLTPAHEVGVRALQLRPYLNVPSGTSGTFWQQGLRVNQSNVFNLPAGSIDDGYRMGIAISSLQNTTDFQGTLKTLTGMRIQYGAHSGSGAGIIRYAYGLLVQGFENGATTINNKWGIRQYPEQFRNYFAGNTGIGVDNPSEKLEVGGNLKVVGGNVTTDTNGAIGIGIDLPQAPLHIQQSSAAGLRFSRDTNHDDYLLGVMGSQGLYIKNASDGRDELIFDGEGSLIVPGKIKAFDASSPAIHVQQVGPQGIKFSRDANHDDYILALAGNKGLYIKNSKDGRDEMVFDGDGNVGIGTQTPTEKLHVQGDIKATGEVIWPDFVFEDEYVLPSLLEIEQHIKNKGHLENVPSAREVSEEGISMMQMDATLLQKIEELTLYLIEQNKKIEQMEKEIAHLKAK